MSWDDYIDTEAVQSPGYIILVVLAELFVMIGFKLQSVWGNGVMPKWQMFITILLLPVTIYILYKIVNR